MSFFCRTLKVLLFLTCIALNISAQTWNTVWKEDFGVAEDFVVKKHGSKSYITNSTKWMHDKVSGFPTLYAGRDHSGNRNGAMLVVSSASKDKAIYTHDITSNLCSGKRYRFGFYAANVSDNTSTLVMQVWNMTTGKMVKEGSTQKLPIWKYTQEAKEVQAWSFYSVDFSVEDGNEYQLKILGTGSSSSTDVFVVDDVTLLRDSEVSVPKVEIEEVSIASDFGNGCEYEAVFTVKYRVMKSWKKLDTSVYILWQMSEDGGVSWTSLQDKSGLNVDELRVMVEGTENKTFRAVMVAASSTPEAKDIAEYIGEYGAPQNGCAIYGISNILSSMKPEATCDFNPQYMAIWDDRFGLCGNHSHKYSDHILVNKYEPGGTEKMTWGQYLLCSDPDSAVYTTKKDANGNTVKSYQFASKRDASGTIIDSSFTSRLRPTFKGDAFALIMMSKEEYMKNPILYKAECGAKELCPCKSYLIHMNFACVGDETKGTRIYPKVTILNNVTGDTLGQRTFFYEFKGFDRKTAAVDFLPPEGYGREGFTCIVELDYKSKNERGERMSDYITFSLDEFSMATCGMKVPTTDIYVDNKRNRILSTGFFCGNDEGRRTVTWRGYTEWKDKYPEAYFVWQRRNNASSPWETLYEERDTVVTYYYDEEEYKPLYRVLVAENRKAIEDKLTYGGPRDPCVIRTNPYDVGFFCDKFKCPKTKFSYGSKNGGVTEMDTAVCFDAKDAVKLKVYQNNGEQIDGFLMRALDEKSNKWGELTRIGYEEGKEGEFTVAVEPNEGKYRIYALIDTCRTDSFYVTIKKQSEIVLAQMDDVLACGDSLAQMEFMLTSGKADKVHVSYGSYKGDGEFGSDNKAVVYSSIESSKFAPVNASAYATYGECKSNEIRFGVSYESISVFSLRADKESICLGDSVSLFFDVQEGVSQESVFTINGIEGDFVGVDSPQEMTVYEMTQMFEVCPPASQQVVVEVLPNPEFEKIDDSGKCEIVVDAKGGTGSYMYDFGEGLQPSNVMKDIVYGRSYNIKVQDDAGCKADTIFRSNLYDIEVKPVFTPNGDGENDVFEVKHLDKYPSASIVIYDRFGKVIMKSKAGDFESWDGTYNGNPMISDDYWYEIDIDEIDKTYTGHFTLIRK